VEGGRPAPLQAHVRCRRSIPSLRSNIGRPCSRFPAGVPILWWCTSRMRSGSDGSSWCSLSWRTRILFVALSIFLLSTRSKSHARVSLVVIHARVREKMEKDLTLPLVFCFFHARRGTGSSANAETVRSAGSECPRKRTPREHGETPRYEKRQAMRVIRRTRQCHVTCPKKSNSINSL
jgi:hypothetical protein